MKKIGVIGAGSWGTALAITLSAKGHQVKIWDLDKPLLEDMEKSRENTKYLKGILLGENLHIVKTMQEALDGVEIAVFSVPAQHFRNALTGAKPFLKEDMIVVNVAKGIEQKTLFRLSQIAEEIMPGLKYAVLSGPSHAEEVGLGLPTTVAVASKDEDVSHKVQSTFITNRFRVYTGGDVTGVELGGSLKNIIALGAGISDGVGFGDNAKAALMTRGLAEITRLGVALGAEAPTFAGLTGVGDLIVTCTSMHSRNRRCGIMIGQGMDPSAAKAKVVMVVEGMFTAEAAYALAKKAGVEMPITEQIYKVIQGKITARDAVEILMGRDKKHEQE